MEESKNHRKASPAVNYFADDYVSLQVLKGIVGVTLACLMVLALVGLYTADVWMILSLEELFRLGIWIFVLYLCVLILSVIVLILIYTARYYRSRSLMKEEVTNLRKLDRFYEQQEKKG